MKQVIALTLLLFTLAFGLSSPPASAQPSAPNDCARSYSRDQFRSRIDVLYARSIGGVGGKYTTERSRVTGANRLALARMVRCAPAGKTSRVRSERVDRERGSWKFYRRIDVMTDYDEWVIPGSIVYRESGTSGYYNAYNDPPDGCSGNGCIGAYQIDATWFNRGCAPFLRYGEVWTPAVQHLCADYIERVQGLAAWGY